MVSIDTIRQKSRPSLEMGSDADQKRLFALADDLLALPDEAWQQALAEREQFNPDLRLATYLAASRRWILHQDRPVSVGVVFAMWGEHVRLQARTPENPNGENSLRNKVRQLRWLTRDSTVQWTIYAVDDGDPRDSAAVAERIVAEDGLEDNVTVLRLQDALTGDYPQLAKLSSVEDSRKGGAIIYGCLRAIADENEAIIYTDADISVHLSQIGLLLKPFVEESADVVVGDRKIPGAMVIKDALRWGPGVPVLRFFQRRIGRYIFSNGVRDTQAPFKLYSADTLARILDDVQTFGFAFDTEWLMVSLKRAYKIAFVPFAFVDSFDESATKAQGAGTTWYSLLQGLAKQVKYHDVPHDVALADFVLTDIEAHHLIDAIIAQEPPQNPSPQNPLEAPASASEKMIAWVCDLKK